MAERHTQRLKYESLVKPLLVLIRTTYSIPDVHANSCGHISSSLLPTSCTWTYIYLECHPHKFSWLHLQPAAYTMCRIMLPSSMPPTQSMWHFHWEHLRPGYFRYQMHFLLFMFPVFGFHSWIDRLQRGSFSQYPTIAAHPNIKRWIVLPQTSD